MPVFDRYGGGLKNSTDFVSSLRPCALFMANSTSDASFVAHSQSPLWFKLRKIVMIRFGFLTVQSVETEAK